MTTIQTTSSAATTTLPVIQMFTPREPDATISDGQKALMQRYGLRFRGSTTQGQASRSLHRFFQANPDEYLAYQAEKKAKAKAAWDRRVLEFHRIAVSRSGELNRVPASLKQISAVMSAAYARRDVPEALVREAQQLLNYGAIGPMASALLDRLPARPEAAQQMN